MVFSVMSFRYCLVYLCNNNSPQHCFPNHHYSLKFCFLKNHNNSCIWVREERSSQYRGIKNPILNTRSKRDSWKLILEVKCFMIISLKTSLFFLISHVRHNIFWEDMNNLLLIIIVCLSQPAKIQSNKTEHYHTRAHTCKNFSVNISTQGNCCLPR